MQSDLATLVSSLPGPTLARLLNMGFTQLETSSAMKYILEDAGYDSVDTFLPGIPAFKKDVSGVGFGEVPAADCLPQGHLGTGGPQSHLFVDSVWDQVYT
jgi:hypothetical protein